MAGFVRCHNCGSSFKVDDPFETEVRCRNCGVLIEVSQSQQRTTEPTDQNLIELEIPVEPAPEELPHAVRTPEPPKEPPEPPGIVEGKTFWYNLIRFLLPFRNAKEFGTFLFIYALTFALPWLGLMCCFGSVAQFIVAGYLCAFYFNLAYAAAEGDDHIPEPESLFEAVGEFWREIVDPFWRFLASFVYVYLPAFAAALIYIQIHDGPIPETGTIHVLLWILIAIGTFLWPMVLLVIACDDWLCLAKPHWIIGSIGRILPAYLAACTALFAVGAAGYYILKILQLDLYHFGLYIIVFWLIIVYLAVYAMRVIGLLYRHYQHKIALELQ